MSKSLDDMFAEAVAAHQRGDAGTAERLCTAVLAADKDHLGALYAFSILALERGDFASAEQHLAHMLLLRTDIAAAHNAHGRALLGLRRPIEALSAFERAIALDPAFAEAIFHRGEAFAAMGRKQEALACFTQVALQMPPADSASAFHNQGNLLFDLGRFEKALAAYDVAIARAPDFPVTHNNRANTLRVLNRLDEALVGYERAITLDPHYADAYNNHGLAQHYARRLDAALASFDRAIALRSDLAAAHYNRGVVLGDLKRPAEALASLDRAVALQPGHAQAASFAFELAAKICDWHDRPHRAHDLIERTRAGEFVIPLVLLGACDDPAIHAKAARNAAQLCPISSPLLPAPSRADGRIRIAYVSADFHDHATARLMAEMFERSDRARFDLWAISLGPSDDSAMRRRIEAAFEHFIDATRLSDQAVVELMRGHAIDIAIDLKGYTRGHRVGIFAQRVAPLQVNYLGYPGTMGAGFIDYIIADRTVITAAAAPSFSESIVYLPDCYQVTDSTRAIPAPTEPRSAWGLPDSAFVFCCFNASHKFTPEVFTVWMNLLRRTGSSVLWLLAEDDDARTNLRREAAARRVDPDRLIFAAALDYERHLSRLAQADLFLDTLPYNAHTTASDALQAGLPLVTCMGSSFPARVAASLLQAVGLPELITRSLDAYEQLAFDLARDPDRLEALRVTLARNRTSRPLFDTQGFCRHIETAYTRMWEHRRRGEKPQSFEVERGA
jgi:predicted O-linked N-acetylglucosamine transferase (SPINDLY family)